MSRYDYRGILNDADSETEPKEDTSSSTRLNRLLGLAQSPNVTHDDSIGTIPVKATRNYAQVRHNSQSQFAQYSDNVTSARGRFKPNFYDSDRHYFYTRDELLHKLIDKWWSTVFHKNWLDLVPSPNAKDVDDAREFVNACVKLHEDVSLQKNLQLVGRIAGLQNISYLGITYGKEDQLPEGDEARLREPVNAEKIKYLTPLQKGVVSWEESDIGPDGEPAYFRLKRVDSKGQTKETRVHASRIIRIVPFPFDDGWEGMNQIDHLGDMLLSKKEMDWSSSENCRRNAIPFTHIQHPNDEDAAQYVTDNFSDGILGKDVFSHPYEEDEQWDIQFLETKGSFPFHEHYDSKIKLISGSASVPTVIALGTGVGTTSGSQVNVDSFYSDISSHQKNIWSPIIREFNERALKAGVLRAYGYKGTKVPDYLLKWNPPYELTGEQLARSNRLDAIASGELGKRAVYTINEIRIKGGDAPFDNPMADELLYEGIPLEDYRWLAMKQLSPRMIEELRAIDAYGPDMVITEPEGEEEDDESDKSDKPDNGSGMETESDTPDNESEQLDNQLDIQTWEVAQND